jgi:hypothetical protein
MPLDSFRWISCQVILVSADILLNLLSKPHFIGEIYPKRTSQIVMLVTNRPALFYYTLSPKSTRMIAII